MSQWETAMDGRHGAPKIMAQQSVAKQEDVPMFQTFQIRH
jgi:hypothetical protein